MNYDPQLVRSSSTTAAPARFFSRRPPERGTLTAFRDYDGQLAWEASHDGRRTFFPCCSRAKAVRTAELLLNVNVSVQESPLTRALVEEHSRRLIAYADDLIARQRRRLARKAPALNIKPEIKMEVRADCSNVLRFLDRAIVLFDGALPAQPAAAETVRVRLPGKVVEVRRADLRWYSDTLGKEPAYLLTRSEEERREGDVPFIRKGSASGKFCVRVEILAAQGEA